MVLGGVGNGDHAMVNRFTVHYNLICDTTNMLDLAKLEFIVRNHTREGYKLTAMRCDLHQKFTLPLAS